MLPGRSSWRGDKSDEMLLKKYEIQKKISEGAFGSILTALDKETNKTVAIKCATDKAKASKEIELLNLFRKSKRGGKMFIVSLIDHFEDKDIPRLVYEYLPWTLPDLLKKEKRLDGEEVCVIGYSMLKALEFLNTIHKDSSLVHGDLTPKNIMFDHSGQVKVVNFESCFYEGKEQSPCGTLGYRAPETYFANKWGKQIDIWSMGCVLAECHSGRILFGAKSEDHYLQLVAEILGLPSDRMFKKWKHVRKFFKLNEKEEWIFRRKDVACGEPGCRNLFQATKSRFGTYEMRLLNLLSRMILYDPDDRIHPAAALSHLLFEDCMQGDLRIIRKCF